VIKMINIYHLMRHGIIVCGSYQKGVQSKYTNVKLIRLHSVNLNSNSRVPVGVRLPAGEIIYDTSFPNEEAIYSEDLESTPITLVPTEMEYGHAKTIAVSKGYISYAVKGKRPYIAASPLRFLRVRIL